MNTIALSTKGKTQGKQTQDRVLSRNINFDKKQCKGCLAAVLKPLLKTGSGLSVALIISGVSVFSKSYKTVHWLVIIFIKMILHCQLHWSLVVVCFLVSLMVL